MIERGDAELDVPLDEHIAFVLEAMKSVGEQLGP
jgi:predicted hydrolase (HD superfamily)